MKLLLLASWLAVGLCQLGGLGGWHNQNVKDPQYQQLLDSLVNQQLTVVPSGFTLQYVQTQVVAGENVKLVLENNGATCEIVIFLQSWTHTQKITHDTCKFYGSRHARAGSYATQNRDDPKWVQLLDKLNNADKLIDLPHCDDMKIMNVETQVVAGMNTKFTLNMCGHTCSLVYFNQPWTNTQQITTDTCGLKVTHTRQIMPGGAMPQDPTDPKWETVLNEVQNKFNLIDMTAAKNVTIVSVSTQVVAGLITHFTLDVDGTMCTLDYFSQPWTNTHAVNHDSCGLKVKASSKKQLGGGWTPQNPSEQKWDDLLRGMDADNLVNLPSGANGYSVVAVETQVVSGMNYKFTLTVHGKTCVLIYYEQVWSGLKEVKSDTCGIKVTHKRMIPVTCGLQTGLQLSNGHPMPGGWAPQDPSDQHWAGVLQELATKYNLVDLTGVNGLEILGVQTQVVAGENYGFRLKVNGQVCELKYFEQVWTNTRQITCDTCGIKKIHKRMGPLTCGLQTGLQANGHPMPGGWAPQNPSDQHWADVLQELATKYNLVDLSGANSMEIVGVQTQVVAGENYGFTLRINGQVCELKYFEQVWTNTRQITCDTCGIKKVHKRMGPLTCGLQTGLQANGHPMPGGWAPQNPSDQHWADVLQELATKYNLVDLSGANSMELVGVQTQVVAGENYGFTLRINGKLCELKYFEQVWTNTRQILCDTCGIKVTHKRQLGGFQPLNAADPKWSTLLQNLDQQYHLLDLNGVNGLEVLGVQEQVVAGVNYKFSLKVNGKPCELTYFEQVWTNTRRITHDTCNIAMKHKRSIDTTAATQQCMSAILDRINMMSNDLFRLVDEHIVKSQSQTNGNEMMYGVHVMVTESACINGQDSLGKTSTSGCAASQTSPIHAVWEANCKYTVGAQTEVSGLNMVSQG